VPFVTSRRVHPSMVVGLVSGTGTDLAIGSGSRALAFNAVIGRRVFVGCPVG
jgi:hypothetical protein